jgi:hypothetical protein
MQSRFALDVNPGEKVLEEKADLPDGGRLDHPWYGAYLYGLERLGVLAHVRFLGTHDWYLEGAQLILRRRLIRGERFIVPHDDCFELLFLRRAGFRASRPALTPGEGAPR